MASCDCRATPCEMPRLATQPSFSPVPQLQTGQRLDFSPIDVGVDAFDLAAFASPLVVVFPVLFMVVGDGDATLHGASSISAAIANSCPGLCTGGVWSFDVGFPQMRGAFWIFCVRS